MSIYDIEVRAIDGRTTTLAEHRGKAMLIVNVASQCGFTPQYKGLEELYLKFKNRGFVVLGFPCNQFGAQEPGSEAEIQNFCSTKYSVSFPMYSKVEVNGEGAHPLFAHLKKSAKGLLGTEAIKWNFTKFIVGKDGNVIERFAPQSAPASLESDIQKIL